MAHTTRKHRFEVLRTQLENERSSFLSHWRDIGDHFLPRRPRFFVSDTNRGEIRNQKIIDTTPTLSARKFKSGMMNGVTSPARPWFRLTTEDPRVAENQDVKEWLNAVRTQMLTAFLRSNLYKSLPVVYGDLGEFGTAVMFVEEDFDTVLRTTTFPIGSYSVSNGENGKVDTVVREFRMTVRQLIERFGIDDPLQPDRIAWERFSLHVRSLWEKDQRDIWVDVVHVIAPNQNYDPTKVESRFKKFISVYYERGVAGSTHPSSRQEPMDDRFLRERGYDFFPALVVRWDVTGEDFYATSCPGMDSLPDAKQLQSMERRGAQALAKMVNPPMTAPTSLQNRKVSILPGDTTFVDAREGQQGFRAAHEVRFRIDLLEQKEEQIRRRIEEAHFVPLFMAISSLDRREITAKEVAARERESLIELGPALQRLNNELLDPLIDLMFEFMLRQGLIPTPPDSIAGSTLKVEYISPMAQAEKMVGVLAVERFVSFVGQMAAVDPLALDKLDRDQAVDEYADMIGVVPNVVVPDDEVAAIRQARAEAQRAKEMAEGIRNASETARNLASADTGGKNALTDIIQDAQQR